MSNQIPPMLTQLLARNPQAQMAMRMLGGKSPAQLEQMARNMAKERGLDIEEFARSLGVTIPSNR